MKRMSKILAVLLLLTCTPTAAKTVEETAKGFYQRGLAAVTKGAYEKSVTLMTKAIELAPTEYRYYNDRGVIHKRMGNLKKAIEDYTTALQIRPDYTNALNNRGVVYLQQGDYSRAIEDFDKALLQGGLEAKILTNRGLAHLKLGDTTRAVEDFRKAISYRPLDYRAFLYLGEAMEKTGQKKKALKMYQLAAGLAKDRKTSKALHQRIRNMKKALTESAQTIRKQRVVRAGSVYASTRKPAGQLKQSETVPGSAGKVLTAGGDKRDESKNVHMPKDSKAGLSAMTLSSLDKLSRQKAVDTFSRVSREIFDQGMKFVDNSEQRKAVVRFQDALQLARRRKNLQGVAWCLLEIGRVHSALGEYFEALPYLKSAMKRFLKMKSDDQAILTLVELARASGKAGLKHEETVFAKRARQMAQSAGYRAILAEIGTAKPKKSRLSHQMDSAEPPTKSVRKSGKVSGSGKIPAHLARVGRGPYLWGKRSREADNQETKSPLPKPTVQPPRPQAVKASADPGDRVSFNIGEKQPQMKPTTAEDLLRLLKKLRKKSDEKGMIDVLETLCKLYERQDEPAKALCCLDAAIGFREKLGRTAQMSRWLHKRGLLRERQGKKALALEDFTRAAAFATTEGKTAQADTSRAKARSVARKLRLDPEDTLAAYQSLWDARKKRQTPAETRALHSIAAVFRDSGRYQPAINYLERTSASLLLEKVDMLTKLGKDREAEETRSESLRTLKRLDYSGYLQTLKTAGEPALARRR